jgi:DegV family protein with EDD domain
MAAPQKVKIIADSTADLPLEWLQRWDIPVIPCFINFGTESYPDDGIALPKPEFYKKLASSPTLPKTSAPPPGVAQDIIQTQLATADHVIVFTVAERLSSVYNSVKIAAQQVDPNRVTVIEGGTLSAALGFMIEAAAKAAEAGWSKEDVLATAQSVRERARLFAAIDTLEYLRRSGRVNSMIASIGTLLQIKPIIEVREGEVTNVNRVRTMNKARQTLIELLRAEGTVERLAVLHTNFPEGGKALRDEISDIALPDTLIMDITTTVGTHIGPNCLGFSWVRKHK